MSATPDSSTHSVQPASWHTEHAPDPGPAREALRTLQMLALAVEHIDDAVMITRADGIIEYVNPGFERITGYPAHQVLGRTPGFLRSGAPSPGFYGQLWQTLRHGSCFRAVFTNRRCNGEIYFEEKTISPVRNLDGEISHFVATGKDVTERMAAARHLERKAHYDALTGLPNRSLLHDRLRQAIQRAQRQGRLVAVQFVDLDRFKIINDTLGHATGDRVLIEAARRLRGCLRATDTVARLGGDEFVLVQEDLEHPDMAEQVARKVLDTFSDHFPIGPHGLSVNVSIGVALYPADGTAPESLLMRADLAMYRAKEAGRNSFRFSESALDAGSMRSLTLEGALREALERREFSLVYQPLFDTRSRQPLAIEALLRWHSPQHGSIPPDHFIPLLEENGRIGDVARWALREALQQARALQEAGHTRLRLAFNLSGRQFRDPGLLPEIRSALGETGFNPGLLDLELTEHALIDNPEAATAVMRALRELGVSLSLDDFGTGYSSLALLAHFPLHSLKIDRGFIHDMERDQQAAIIVRSIIGLARNLGLQVIAEGVENLAQLALLQELGCHCIQGQALARPLTPKELGAALPLR